MLAQTRLGVGCLAVVVVLASARPAPAAMLYATSITAGQIYSVDTVTGTVTPVLNTGHALDSLIFDPSGRIVYTELNDGIVNAFNPTTHATTTLATGLNGPIDLALEPGQGSVLVSTTNSLTRVSLSGGILGTVSTGGLRPDGVIYDGSGNLFVNLSTGFTAANSSVRRIDPTTGAVLATTGNTGRFLDGLTYDSFTGFLYAADYNNGRIVRIDPTTMAVTVLTTTGVTMPGGGPDGIVSDGQGHLYIASRANGEVVEYTFATNTLRNVAHIDGLDDLAPVSGLGAPNTTPAPPSLLLAAIGVPFLILGNRLRGRRTRAA